MLRHRIAAAWAPSGALVSTLLFAGIYVLVGEVSFATAYIQTNTAAVWIPSGYSVGLMIVKGLNRWPAVALGSFLLNTLVNVGSKADVSFALSIAIAIPIALGNAGEAILGAYIARRFASGAAFFSRSRSFAVFALAVVPVAPLVSMGVGVAASRLGGLPASGSILEVMLTWYVANAVGILIFAGPVVLMLTRTAAPEPPGGIGGAVEAILLAVGLVFVSQAICGVYFNESLRDWPKSYMVIPLLFWASFRFGTYGAFLSILLVALISVVGTMRGFAVFPGGSPSRSLIYLQIFLGMLSIMTLAISAGLAENWDLRANLEAKVRARTQDVERYLREKEVFTTLVAHDLQSPLYGVRNALRTVGEAVRGGRLSPDDLASALSVMDETCSTLAERVASLLAPDIDKPDAIAAGPPVALSTILRKIASAHRLSMDGKAATLRFRGDPELPVSAPDQVEHVLDILIDNAIKFSPAGAPVEIVATRTEADIEICVTDSGCGVAPDKVSRLFRRRVGRAPDADAPGAGLGLYLAREQVAGLGGTLTYAAGDPGGSSFRLVLPV
jgi:signal transduction histidine kinase